MTFPSGEFCLVTANILGGSQHWVSSFLRGEEEVDNEDEVDLTGHALRQDVDPLMAPSPPDQDFTSVA